MKKIFLFVFFAAFLAAPALAGDADDIKAILKDQAKAWSRGDIEAFMEPYWKSDELRFASGGTITYGWQATMDGYKERYDTPAKMGELSFKALDIKVLSNDYALVFGRFELTRETGDLGGLFTLLWQKRPEGWRIIADHTSSNELPMVVVEE